MTPLTETHGPRFELVRHFLSRSLDSGDWSRVAAGAMAMLASSWILLAGVLLFKYKKLAELNLQDRFQAEARADVTSLTLMAVCLAVLLVAVLWQSVYPTLRDCLALASLPVSPADIFVAKFGGLVIAYAAFVLLLILPATIVLFAVTGANPVSTFLTMAGACSLAFFGPIVLQGALLNILPVRAFETALITTQALLVTASLGGFPLAAWKGHAFIGDLSPSLKSLIVPPFAAIVIYTLSCHRYRRLLVEGQRSRGTAHRDWLSAVLDFFVADPREQAALMFMWKTIRRSRVHRLVLLIYAALAAAYVAATSSPLAVILFTLLGLRHLFSLPTELGANWMFRIVERDGRLAWLSAVERFAIAGLALIAVPAAILTSLPWAVIAAGLGLIGFEYLFRDWCKLPFTCSYVPGKRPLIVNCAILAGLWPLMLGIDSIVSQCASNVASFAVILVIELSVWTYLRHSRKSRWGRAPLIYEEQQVTEVDSYGLAEEGTVLAQEQFSREWKDHVRHESDAPILRPLEGGETRAGRLWEWASAVPQDLRFALRVLVKSPGFALTVVLTLGLGLGLNAAFFTVFNAFLLRPLAVRDPASLVSVNFESKYKTPVHLAWEDYAAISAGETAASTVEGTGFGGSSARVGFVSSNYFSLLGVGPALGRPFVAGEQDPVLVLSYRTWQNRFGGDASILGKKVLLGGVPFEVIGVAAREFAGVAVGAVAVATPDMVRFGGGAADLWAPIEVWNRLPGVAQYPVRGVIARLRPGVGKGQARAMFSARARQATANRPDYDQIFSATVESLDIPITWTALRYSLPLLIAFGLTMLIPCANAANMMLARSLVRQKEFGVRLSLGASRGRIVRQLLTEGFVLAGLAAAAGLALADGVLHIFARLIYTTAPPLVLFRLRIPDFPIDAHVFLYMLIVSGFTTVLFALAPAAQTTRIEFGSFRASLMRDLLIVGQVSACVMLLVVAGVLLRGTGRIARLDRGYDARGVYGIANQSPEDAQALAAILQREPWVDSLAVMGGALNAMESVEVSNPSRPGWDSLYLHFSSSEFFRLVRIPILRGRAFTREESENRAAVAVVSELAAKRLWPGEDALGKVISVKLARFQEARVIGISRDIVSKLQDGAPRAMIHFPDALRRGTMLAVRGKGTPEQTAWNTEAALARAPGALHGARVVAFEDTLQWESYPQQATSWLSTMLGLVALLLTSTGLYGVMSYLVSQRTREIGIRMALGASQTQVAKFVLGHSARLAGAGIVFGILLAIGVIQYTAARIDMVIDMYDLPAYSVSLAVVVIAALLATIGPARRSCRVDPQVALRLDN